MNDSTATSRVLRLLSLLQSRRSWPGTELADRVGVTVRTVRRDIERLRELGYAITAERGVLGGYRLEAGSDLPPLLFTDDEAVALALALSAGTTNGGIRDLADLTVSVLAKLEQVLPSQVRSRIRAVQAAVVAPGLVQLDNPADPECLAMLALACRDSEIVRFSYLAADGTSSARRTESVALVPVARRWYLLAWDADRDDWRTFRVDRISHVQRTRVLVDRREVPGEDAAAFVQRRFALGNPVEVEATVRIEASLAEVDAYLGRYTSGLSAEGDVTLWKIRAERVEFLFGALAWLRWQFEIVAGAELQRFVDEFDVRRPQRSTPTTPGRET